MSKGGLRGALSSLHAVVKPHGPYRPDIDGLRALAVLAVLFYHYAKTRFPSGFIGVDIFFVISGYLITGILVKAVDERQFETFGQLLSDFYQRRARRIFPPLILVLTFCLVVGWLALFPSEYDRLGKHVAASAGYVENFTLWAEAGYFDHGAVEKPLLHLWSLAVEEQFYIFWPLLLWFLMQRRRLLMPSILAIAGVSFALNVWLVFHGDATHSFYFPTTRAWELMAGAWLAVDHRRGPPWLDKWPAVQSWLGLALILAGLVLLTPQKAFPGFWALLPIVGTMLILNAGKAEKQPLLNRCILSWKPAVSIGLISYGLYLWHWALLSLATIVFGSAVAGTTHQTKAALVVSSIVLAWITYRYFEQPIRRSRSLGASLALGAAVLVLGVAGLGVYLASGIPDRPFALVSQQGQQYVASIKEAPSASSHECFDPQFGVNLSRKIKGDLFPDRWHCVLGDPRGKTLVVAYGDSHAQSMIPALDRFGKAYAVKVIFTGMSGCLTLLDAVTRGAAEPQACTDLGRKVTRLVKAMKPQAVVLIQAWSGYTSPGEITLTVHENGSGRQVRRVTGAAAFQIALNKTLTYYQTLRQPVLLLEDNPHQLTRVPRSVIRFDKHPTDRILNRGAITLTEHRRAQAQVNDMLSSVVAKYPTAHILNIDSALCGPKICPWAVNHKILYYNSGHLSVAGAMRVYPLLARHLSQILARDQAAAQ